MWQVPATPPTATQEPAVDSKLFELSNHLGNVLATLSDKKLGYDTTNDGQVDYFLPDVRQVSDYHPFGMAMNNRTFTYNLLGYKAGFNGKDLDKETNSYDLGERVYDPRVARLFSVDPLDKKYPMLTPYQFASNDPIESVDLLGEQRADYRLVKNKDGTTTLTFLGFSMFTYKQGSWPLQETVEMPLHVRIEYNNEHYLFAWGPNKNFPGDYSFNQRFYGSKDFSDFVKNPNPDKYESQEDRHDALLSELLLRSALGMAEETSNRAIGKMSNRIQYRGRYTNTSTTEQVARANSGNIENAGRVIMYHYTTAEGEQGILSSQTLRASTKANNPKDARYGDGQYFTDITPGSKTPAELSKAFLNIPYQGRKFSNFVAIDVTGLNVQKGRDGVYYILNSGDLDIRGRIVGSGSLSTKKQTTTKKP
jgi:RHS repeat-associated protein